MGGGKSVAQVTRYSVGWTNQGMNGVAEQIMSEEKPKKGLVVTVNNKQTKITRNGKEENGLYNIDLPDGVYLIRKLFPLEAERLQTLPDNYTEGISDTQRYKCIGNGWTVDVIAHILSFLPEEYRTVKENV